MRNTRKSGQILRSKKRPHPILRSGRGSPTNSNTSRQIPARVIDAACDTLPASAPKFAKRAQCYAARRSRSVGPRGHRTAEQRYELAPLEGVLQRRWPYERELARCARDLLPYQRPKLSVQIQMGASFAE